MKCDADSKLKNKLWCNRDCRKEICEKGYRNRTLTDKRKVGNKEKYKTRCRIEYKFELLTNTILL